MADSSATASPSDNSEPEVAVYTRWAGLRARECKCAWCGSLMQEYSNRYTTDIDPELECCSSSCARKLAAW